MLPQHCWNLKVYYIITCKCIYPWFAETLKANMFSGDWVDLAMTSRAFNMFYINNGSDEFISLNVSLAVMNPQRIISHVRSRPFLFPRCQKIDALSCRGSHTFIRLWRPITIKTSTATYRLCIFGAGLFIRKIIEIYIHYGYLYM